MLIYKFILFCKEKIALLFLLLAFVTLFTPAKAVINGLEPVPPDSQRAKIVGILAPKQDFLVCVISHYLADDGYFHAHFVVKESSSYKVFRRKLQITDENGKELKNWHENTYIQSHSVELTQPMVAKLITKIEKSHKRISFDVATNSEEVSGKYDVLYQRKTGGYLGFIAECDVDADSFIDLIFLSTFYKNDDLKNHFKKWIDD